MKEFEKIAVAQGVDLVCVDANRFKTNEIAVSFCTPLSKNTASVNALLISLLSHSGKEYPDMLSLNKKLAMLYGASLSSVTQKIGENQVLSIHISSLDDKFSLADTKISTESIELLLSLIFNPNLDENGDFLAEDIEREKRFLCEKLKAEENEKRTYALRQAEKYMFKDEPYSVNAYGSVEDVSNITPSDVKSAWENLIKTAKIQFAIVGTADCNDTLDCIKSKFDAVERDYASPVSSVFVPVATEVNEILERIDVKQGKLVLGFRVNMKSDDAKTPAMRSFCDVFGGGPYSKLFANVREKLSLCYYCSARYLRQKSCILIQCGCEEENMDKAVAEILNQLEEIKKGNFDSEFASSKISLTDSINSVNDESMTLLAWYQNQIVDANTKSPAQSAKENDSVAKEDIQRCAELITLDLVYKLAGNKEGE